MLKFEVFIKKNRSNYIRKIVCSMIGEKDAEH